jgi:16S rRNA C1402 N4-methylase RsmH
MGFPFDSVENIKYLDIGTGRGEHLKKMIQKYGQSNIVSVDTDLPCVNWAKRLYPDVTYVHGDWSLALHYGPFEYAHVDHFGNRLEATRILMDLNTNIIEVDDMDIMTTEWSEKIPQLAKEYGYSYTNNGKKAYMVKEDI